MNFIGSFYHRYLSLGFSVIPIKTLAYASILSPAPDKEAKRPIVKWEPYQTRRVSAEMVDGNWAKLWPSAGIALVNGLLSDVLTFDDDRTARPPLAGSRTPDEETKYQALVTRVGSHAELARLYKAGDELHDSLMDLQTARSRTSRGRHFHFRMPRNDDGVPVSFGSKIGFLPGWDVRGEGGYVILPPSIHPSGTAYVWENEPEDGLLDPPHWLMETVTRLPAVATKTLVAGQPAWQISGPLVEGFRNDKLARWIGKQLCSSEYESELKWPMVLDMAQGMNLRLGRPPLPADEVSGIFTSISSKERERRKTDVGSLNRVYEPGAEPEIFTATQLGLMDLHAPDYAIRNYILDGTTQLFGKPKAGKSWLLLQMGVAVALGQPLFEPTASMYAFANHPEGFDSHQGDVLILTLEDSHLRMRDRMQAILKGRPMPARFHYATHWRNLHDGGLADIESWLDDMPNPRLVGIDPLAAFVGVSSLPGSVFRAEYRMFRPIWELGQRRKVPIVIADHASKSKGKLGSGDPFDSGAGTLGSQAAVDTVMVMEHDDRGPFARISYKGRDIERGHLDIEHSKSNPIWKIAAISAEIRASKGGKRQNGHQK